MKDVPLEARIAGVLRTGVLLGGALLALGTPWLLTGHASEGDALSVGAALRELPAVHPETLAALGVVVLVATPILQLITSGILFWRKRDRLYVVFVALVCGIVATGALLARGGG